MVNDDPIIPKITDTHGTTVPIVKVMMVNANVIKICLIHEKGLSLKNINPRVLLQVKHCNGKLIIPVMHIPSFAKIARILSFL
jgi:hypothetical protein